jgi:CDP-diacylglycerol--glycerol-3-phosphate 3-phosphatidyltransferase
VLDSLGRKISSPVIRPIAFLFSKIGLGCDALSIIGLFTACTAGLLFARGDFELGGVLVLVAGFFDLIDGELARISNQETKWGAFLDSSVDRYADSAIFCGIIYNYLWSSQTQVMVGLAAFTGAVLTSYTKARAERFIDKCQIGLIERPERLILIAFGGMVNRMEFVLWILAILGHITVLQRIIYTKKELMRYERD